MKKRQRFLLMLLLALLLAAVLTGCLGEEVPESGEEPGGETVTKTEAEALPAESGDGREEISAGETESYAPEKAESASAPETEGSPKAEGSPEAEESRETKALLHGWVQQGEAVYYYDAEGLALTGLSEIEGENYYFTEEGKRLSGWLRYGEAYYYFDEDGKGHRGFLEQDGDRYYFIKGLMATGLTETEEGSLYFWKDGRLCDGWLRDEKGLRFFEKGTLVEEKLNPQGLAYSFDEEGYLCEGWYRDQYYVLGIRQWGLLYIPRNRVYREGETVRYAWYYFYEDGSVGDGFLELEDGTHLFCLGSAENGFTEREGELYYCEQDGYVLKGWQVIEEGLYYFHEDGTLARGETVDGMLLTEAGVAVAEEDALYTEDNIQDYIEQAVASTDGSIGALYNYMRGHFHYRYMLRSSVPDMLCRLANTGYGSCYDYAYMLQALLQEAGYEAMVIGGSDGGYGEHYWVLVQVREGVWRHLDAVRKKDVYLLTDSELQELSDTYEEYHYKWDRDACPAAE